jgi:SAM-dependent methyltransferase
MKRCLKCNYVFEEGWQCRKCGFQPVIINDCLAFCPEIECDYGGFPEESFEEIYKFEDNYFWFESRNKLIVWAIKKYFSQVKKLLEIGCGTGIVLSYIHKNYPEIDLYGSDIFSSALKYAAQRIKGVQYLQIDARNVPFWNEFDLVTAFDVLEHIPEDTIVLENLAASLKQGGGLIITVPQHRFLWSAIDKVSGHVRRYTVNEIREKVEHAGFIVEHATSFVTLLFPFLLVSRLANKKLKKDFDPLKEIRINNSLNRLFKIVMKIERLFINCGISLSFGGSLLLVARKVN